MRRVYDDRHYDIISQEVLSCICDIPAKTVSEYSHGMERAKVHLVREYIAEMTGLKFGKNEHAYGIGNNNAIEIIVTDDDEEQICGLLHLTNDMFGGVIAWVSDIDGNRETPSRTIRT